MLNHYLNVPYQRWILGPLVNRIQSICTPTQITLLSGLIGLGLFPALKFNMRLCATLLLLLSGFLDTLDGALARHQGLVTNRGAALDIFVDRMVELTVILGLFSLGPQYRGWICISMLGSILLCVTSFLVVGIFTNNQSGKSFYYSPGIMERAEAFLFFILMIWLPDHLIGLGLIFIALTLWTALFRIIQFVNFTDLLNEAEGT